MSRKISSSVVAEDAERATTTASVSDGDDQLQPEAGAGVDHLAQLDEREARERDGFMRAPP